MPTTATGSQMSVGKVVPHGRSCVKVAPRRSAIVAPRPPDLVMTFRVSSFQLAGVNQIGEQIHPPRRTSWVLYRKSSCAAASRAVHYPHKGRADADRREAPTPTAIGNVMPRLASSRLRNSRPISESSPRFQRSVIDGTPSSSTARTGWRSRTQWSRSSPRASAERESRLARQRRPLLRRSCSFANSEDPPQQGTIGTTAARRG